MRKTTLRLRLSIPPEACLRYYQGEVRDVLARSEDGRRVRFPAAALRQHIRRDGVQGRFELEYDEHHRLVALRRIGD